MNFYKVEHMLWSTKVNTFEAKTSFLSMNPGINNPVSKRYSLRPFFPNLNVLIYDIRNVRY